MPVTNNWPPRGHDHHHSYSCKGVFKSTGVGSDQTIVLNGPITGQVYPAPLRRVSYYAAEIDKGFVFLTNNFALAADTVAALYRCHWQVGLFFKWIKQRGTGGPRGARRAGYRRREDFHPVCEIYP
jgi:hypothetical protein